jgi:hypothetical protein
MAASVLPLRQYCGLEEKKATGWGGRKIPVNEASIKPPFQKPCITSSLILIGQNFFFAIGDY